MPSKRPAEVLDYDLDYSQWLPSGDTVASATVTAEDGITLGEKVLSDTAVKQWVSGGTADTEYTITCTATTTGGRIKQDSIIIPVTVDRD